MNITPDELINLMNMQAQSEIVSLDAPVGENGDAGMDRLVGETMAALIN